MSEIKIDKESRKIIGAMFSIILEQNNIIFDKLSGRTTLANERANKLVPEIKEFEKKALEWMNLDSFEPLDIEYLRDCEAFAKAVVEQMRNEVNKIDISSKIIKNVLNRNGYSAGTF